MTTPRKGSDNRPGKRTGGTTGGRRSAAGGSGRETTGTARGSASPGRATGRSSGATSERASQGAGVKRTASKTAVPKGAVPKGAAAKGTASKGIASKGASSRGAASKGAEQDGFRINKVLADAGVASRRAADAMIAEGRVQVNGKVVTELGTRVTMTDRVSVDGKIIADPARHVYILLNKPKDTITTTKDERGRRTVLDLVEYHDRIYPVGRLDRNTTGILLLTNDGDLAHRMMHPRYQVERFYEVVLDRPLEQKHAKKIAAGVELDNGDTTQPCDLFVEERDAKHVSILLREGKNREVRRLFEAFDYEVIRLHRSMYAGLTTRGLARGEWRYLTRKELSALRRQVNLADKA